MLTQGKDIEPGFVGQPRGSKHLLEALLGADAPSVAPLRRQLAERIKPDLHAVSYSSLPSASKNGCGPSKSPIGTRCVTISPNGAPGTQACTWNAGGSTMKAGA